MSNASVGTGAIAAAAAPSGGPTARIPIYLGFKREILPVLLLLWAAFVTGWSLTGQPIFWALIPWATVTTLMLWPVARRLGRAYLSYRSVLFVLGVLSMAWIIVTGLVLQSGLPYAVKLAVFLFLPIDLTVFAILPSLKWAIGRPVRMFFRPDLVFGDGRVLCCGTLALVLGLRYFVGHPPPEGIPIPIPKWDWWAILWAITLGFIPLIAIRGVLKILLRLRRIRDEVWGGWGSTLVRELLLVATVMMIGFGFHNAFKGFTPFVESHTAFHQYSWVPVLGILLGTAWLVLVRGGYKRAIGEPFIRETIGQTFVKEILYVAGIIVVMWSFMSMLDTELSDIERAGYQHLTWLGDQPMPGEEHHAAGATWPASGFILPGIKGIILGPWNWVGLALVAWGVVVLVPFRVLAQHYQRHAIVAQMAAVILPTFGEAQRGRILRKVMDALDAMPTKRAGGYMHAMLEGLDATGSAETRALMARSRVEVLASCAAPTREHLMECMANGLARLTDAQRVRAMADTMGAVAELPSEDRQAFIAKMTALTA